MFRLTFEPVCWVWVQLAQSVLLAQRGLRAEDNAFPVPMEVGFSVAQQFTARSMAHRDLR